MAPRNILYIVIHEADTPTGKPFTQHDIDAWHADPNRPGGPFKRDMKWRDIFNSDLKAIGYHYVIGIHGELWTGRHINEVPAAVAGYNAVSVNICLIGKGRYTPSQWTALKTLVVDLQKKYRQAAVKGHCEFSTAMRQGKTCPDFDVPRWLKNGMTPDPEHIA